MMPPQLAEAERLEPVPTCRRCPAQKHGHLTVTNGQQVTVAFHCVLRGTETSLDLRLPSRELTHCPWCEGPLLLSGTGFLDLKGYRVERVCNRCGTKVTDVGQR